MKCVGVLSVLWSAGVLVGVTCAGRVARGGNEHADRSSKDGPGGFRAEVLQRLAAAGAKSASWEGERQVGMAEILLRLYDHQQWDEPHPKGAARQAQKRLFARMEKLLTGAIRKGAPAGKDAPHWCRRALMLRLFTSPAGGTPFRQAADLAVEADPKNGAAWVFLAEQAWSEGNLSRWQECIRKADAAEVYTFRGALSAKRMMGALQSMGALSQENARTLVRLVGPPTVVFSVLARHAAMLEFVPILQDATGVPKASRTRLSAREYLSYHTFSAGPGAGIFSSILHRRLLRRAMSRDLRAGSASNTDEPKKNARPSSLRKEDGLSDAASNFLADEAAKLLALAKKGDLAKVKAFLRDPVAWRAGLVREWNRIGRWKVGEDVWRTFWAAPQQIPEPPPSTRKQPAIPLPPPRTPAQQGSPYRCPWCGKPRPRDDQPCPHCGRKDNTDHKGDGG